MDDKDNWVGGTSVCVQVGDQLDRGDEEIEILYLLEKLKVQAASAGGMLISMNGNHETMNAYGRFRYATKKGEAQFARYHQMSDFVANLKRTCGLRMPQREPRPDLPLDSDGRRLALCPGGSITRHFLASQNVCQIVGRSLFVHAGLLPHVMAAEGLDRMNVETRAWMQGLPGHEEVPRFLRGKASPVWNRDFAGPPHKCGCPSQEVGELLNGTLEASGTVRMLVGHTIQRDGINSACQGRVFRLDVGMSRGCGDSRPEVLVIEDDEVVSVLAEGVLHAFPCPTAEGIVSGAYSS